MRNSLVGLREICFYFLSLLFTQALSFKNPKTRAKNATEVGEAAFIVVDSGCNQESVGPCHGFCAIISAIPSLPLIMRL